MAKFDSMHFDNSKGHALASLRTAEKALQDGDLELAQIALNIARPYIVVMKQEKENDGATLKEVTKYNEMKTLYDTLVEKYGDLKDEEDEEIETTDTDETEPNPDADVRKLNVALTNALNIIHAVSEDFSVDHIEDVNTALLLIDELAETVENDLNEIREKLEDAKKDAEIVAKVEAVKEAFESLDRDKIVEDTIERLREYKNRDNGIEDVELTHEAIFAAIHQESNDLKIEWEVVKGGRGSSNNVWRANRFGVERDRYGCGPSLVYEVETNADGWSRDLNLLLKKTNHERVPLATIRIKGYDDDTIRKISALGCEYMLAFKHIAKNI